MTNTRSDFDIKFRKKVSFAVHEVLESKTVFDDTVVTCIVIRYSMAVDCMAVDCMGRRSQKNKQSERVVNLSGSK